jgi:hypothetical protein
MEYNEKAYTTKEISTTLSIGDSTLRKWCIALEKNRFNFIRNDANKRLFVDHDLVILRHFQTLVQDNNMPLDNAAMVVVDRFGKGAFEVGTGIVPHQKEEEQRDLMRSNEVLKELQEHIKRQNDFILQQEQFNKELISRLEKQQNYIEERLNERDRALVDTVREMQETRKLIAATQEESKKGFFSRLFGK